MIGTKTLAPAVAALLLVAVTALAQPVQDAGTVTAPADKPSQTDEEKSPVTPKGPAEAKAPAGKSPSDYRASEEISEDLPVSFPVDI